MIITWFNFLVNKLNQDLKSLLQWLKEKNFLKYKKNELVIFHQKAVITDYGIKFKLDG